MAWCLSNIGLYGHGALELHISCLTEECKYTKVRLNMTLTESPDEMIRTTAPSLATGRKWTPAKAASQICSQTWGHCATGAAWKRWILTWDKSSPVAQGYTNPEEKAGDCPGSATRCATAVAQSEQGQWTTWENLEQRKLT